MRNLLLVCLITLLPTAPRAQNAGAAASPSAPVVSLATTAGADPTAATLNISTDPAAAWTATMSSSWLTLSATSGTGPATVTVGAQTAGMLPGIYSDVIQVSAGGPPAPVSVTLSIAAARWTPVVSGNNWYVSPDGTSGGDGSLGNPWDIVTAFAQPSPVQPGDTIWLRGGKYGDGAANSVIASNLVGTAAAPIIVRAYPGERAIIDAWLQVGCCDQAPNPKAGAYTWFWGLEFASFNPDRTSGTSGPPQWAAQANHAAVDAWAPGTRIINCIVHDTSGGISMWKEATDTEAYGNLVYNIGGYGTDRGHGHGFYLQNAAPSYKEIVDNITFNNFGEGIQMYGGLDTYVQNFHVESNVSFNNGSPGSGNNTTNGTAPAGARDDNVIVGAGNGGPAGIVLLNNHFYHTPLADDGYNELGFASTPLANDLIATGNDFIGGSSAVALYRWNSLVFQNNSVYAADLNEVTLFYRDDQKPSTYAYDHNRYFGSGKFTVYAGCVTYTCSNGRTLGFSDWKSNTGVDANSTYTPGPPTGVQISVRPNLYEPGRANITVLNWDMRPNVQVDLSASGIQPGDAFEIRDGENWFGGAVVSGTYTGGPVTIPMTGLHVALPNGVVPNPQPHTAPQLGVFVLLSGDSIKMYPDQYSLRPGSGQFSGAPHGGRNGPR